MLERGLQREKFRIPNDGISKAQNVARRAWARALESAVTDPNGIDDWFGDAINQPGGKLAEFWIRSISVVREVSGDSWKAIPEEIAKSLHSTLANSSNAGGYARAIFATSLDFFFSIDSSFCEKELLPLFDWQTNALRAEQCWNGFLQYGRWLPGFVSALLPHFERTVVKIDRFPEKMQHRVVAHVSTLALYLIGGAAMFQRLGRSSQWVCFGIRINTGQIVVRWVNGANDRRRASRVRRPSRARASHRRPTRGHASRHNIRRSSDAATKADSSRPSCSRSRLGSSCSKLGSSLGNRNSRSRDHRNSRRRTRARNNRCQKRK